MIIKEFLSIFEDSLNSFDGQERDEKVLLLLRQHIFHIIARMALFILLFFIPIVAGVLAWPYIVKSNLSDLFFLISSVWYLLLWLETFRSLTIYTLNTVIITSKRIVENDQHGLFNRQVSELYNHRIQDVTTHTRGVLETMLDFGNVIVQTAASERQFCFAQVPKPDKVKEVIMQITASRHSGVKTGVYNSGT
ncbi:MAG: PH domain-containing protein [Minisyncoccia bacterium]